MPFLAFALILAGAIATGSALRRILVEPEDGRGFRLVLYLASGLLLLHAVLAWLDLVGIPWHPLAVAGAAAVVALAGRRLSRGRSANEAPGGGRGSRLRLGWAGLAGGGVVALFALLAASERIAFPDFVYHWGVKGHRYFLAAGIDYDFLAAEWNLVAHRDYPQLVPELFALQSMVAGRFSEPALLLWSAVFFAALLLACREALEAWTVAEERARLTFVILALAMGVFAVGHQLAGSVDWIVALALTAALPALLRPPNGRGELQIGMLAALAASAKLEGIPLAVILVGVAVWRRLRPTLAARRQGAADPLDRRAARRTLAGAVARLGAPTVVAVTPWLVQGLRHDLFREPQSGAFEIERAPAIAAAVWRTMLLPEWHLVPLVLLLLPLLFVRGETRLAGVIVSLQLAGYLLRYFTAAFDYEFSVRSSFPRLIFHVLPAVTIGLAVVLDRWARRRRAQGRAEALLGNSLR